MQFLQIGPFEDSLVALCSLIIDLVQSDKDRTTNGDKATEYLFRVVSERLRPQRTGWRAF